MTAATKGHVSPLKRFARRVYRLALGDLFRFVSVLALGVVPLLKDFDVVKSQWWMAAWIILFLLKAVWDLYLNGWFAEGASHRIAEIHAAVAGSIDTVTQVMMNSHDRRLAEETSKSLATALLHRIHDYCTTALHTVDGVRLRATLAVPLKDTAGRVRAIRVWCYDQTYDDRRWTELSIRGSGEELPGSPMCFISGRYQIIDDIHALQADGVDDLADRKFRSVLSIPVKAGGPGGTTLAVLNIDATQQRYFNADAVEQTIIPLVAPTVNVIALVLLIRQEGIPYAFHF